MMDFLNSQQIVRQHNQQQEMLQESQLPMSFPSQMNGTMSNSHSQPGAGAPNMQFVANDMNSNGDTDNGNTGMGASKPISAQQLQMIAQANPAMAQALMQQFRNQAQQRQGGPMGVAQNQLQQNHELVVSSLSGNMQTADIMCQLQQQQQQQAVRQQQQQQQQQQLRQLQQARQMQHSPPNMMPQLGQFCRQTPQQQQQQQRYMLPNLLQQSPQMSGQLPATAQPSMGVMPSMPMNSSQQSNPNPGQQQVNPRAAKSLQFRTALYNQFRNTALQLRTALQQHQQHVQRIDAQRGTELQFQQERKYHVEQVAAKQQALSDLVTKMHILSRGGQEADDIVEMMEARMTHIEDEAAAQAQEEQQQQSEQLSNLMQNNAHADNLARLSEQHQLQMIEVKKQRQPWQEYETRDLPQGTTLFDQLHDQAMTIKAAIQEHQQQVGRIGEMEVELQPERDRHLEQIAAKKRMLNNIVAEMQVLAIGGKEAGDSSANDQEAVQALQQQMDTTPDNTHDETTYQSQFTSDIPRDQGQGVPPALDRVPTLSVQQFQNYFQAFCVQTGVSINQSNLQFDGKPIDLHALHVQVLNAGGADNVDRADGWDIIGAKLGFVRLPKTEPGPSRLAQRLQQIHQLYLRRFDAAYMTSIARKRNGMGQVQLSHSNNVVPDPPTSAQLLQLSTLSVDELRQRRIPEQAIAYIEKNRAMLQSQLQTQRVAQNKPQSIQLPVLHGANVQMQKVLQGTSFVNGNPMAPAPPNVISTQQPQPNGHSEASAGVNEPNSAQMRPPCKHIKKPFVQDRLPTELELREAKLYVHAVSQDFKSRVSKIRGYQVKPEEMGEFEHVLKELVACSEVVEKQLPFHACYIEDGKFRKVLAAILTANQQKAYAAAGQPSRCLVTLAHLHELRNDVKAASEDVPYCEFLDGQQAEELLTQALQHLSIG